MSEVDTSDFEAAKVQFTQMLLKSMKRKQSLKH